MVYVTIRPTQILFRGISSHNLAGNLKYLLFDFFVHW